MSTMAYKILIVDDSASNLEETRQLLVSEGYRVETATNGDEAIEKIRTSKRDYALALLDYNMEGKNGAETNKALLEIHPQLNTVFLSADEGRLAVRDAWYTGARCFIEKGDDETLLKEVKELYFRYVDDHSLFSNSEVLKLNEERIKKTGLIGCSPATLKIIEQAQKYSPMKEIVRIEGETGVGKERIAHLLHSGSQSRFFAVNCATFNGNHDLMKSELFGHTKGAFTGADKDKKGIFEEANGGTVFLDEIDTLGIAAQDSLLRVFRENKVRPVGATREYSINFRLVVACKPDFELRCNNGEIKPDFFERLNVLVIQIPPLRERPEDIPLLADYFAKRWEQDNAQKKYFLLGAIEELKKYDWPRNIAQLEHLVIRLCANINGEKITRKDVKEFLTEKQISTASNRDQFQESRRQQLLNIARNAKPGSLSLRGLSKLMNIPYTTLYRDVKSLGINLGNK